MAQHSFESARRLLHKCRTFFDKHYLLANVGIYGSMYTLGDITCQMISHANTKTPHDWERTKRMGTIGSTTLAVMNTYYYRMVDRALKGGSPKIVLIKLVLDTFAWGPVCKMVFIGGITVLEGKQWSEVKQEVRRKFYPVFKSGLLIWPLAQGINFAFINPRFRMAYISIVGFCWINILSYLKHKRMDKPLEKKLNH